MLPEVSPSAAAHPYAALGPDLVVEAIEALGYACDGRVLALNSYENRVYQVGREEGGPVVVKFYRPGRWSTAAILEEHEFGLELAHAEIPVIAPEVHDGRSLFELGGFRYAVYPRAGGRSGSRRCRSPSRRRPTGRRGACPRTAPGSCRRTCPG